MVGIYWVCATLYGLCRTLHVGLDYSRRPRSASCPWGRATTCRGCWGGARVTQATRTCPRSSLRSKSPKSYISTGNQRYSYLVLYQKRIICNIYITYYRSVFITLVSHFLLYNLTTYRVLSRQIDVIMFRSEFTKSIGNQKLP